MKPLVINHSGILFKLAKIGGMKASATIKDKAIEKNNELLDEALYKRAITVEEYHSRYQDYIRPLNFCEFTRRVVLGGVLFGLMLLAISILAIVMLLGTISIGMWVYQGFPNPDLLGKFWGSMFGLGVVCWCGTSVLTMLLTWVRFQDEIKDFVKKILRIKPKTPLTAEQLQEKIRQKDVRSAFWLALRNKTCFKVEFKE